MIVGRIISPFFYMAMRIVSVVIYLLTIISGFGGRINPDYLTLPSLLCLTFPYFVILTIILIIFWGVTRKIIFCGLGVLTLFICMSPLSEAFPMGSSKKATPGKQTFRIISWNVLHTDDIRQPDYPGNRAVEYMIDSEADIICLAELTAFEKYEIKNFSDSLRSALFEAYPYRDGRPGTDLNIISKYPIKRLDRISYNNSGICRYDFFQVEFPDSRELIVAMVHLYSYGLSEEERQVVTEIKSVSAAESSVKEFKGSIKNKMRVAFRNRAEDANSLRKALDEIPEDIPLIVCGDFNDVPASWTYNVVRGDDLRDAYAETNFGPAITYNLHAFYFHIDQMLYRGPLKALDLTVVKSINSSDHYPLLGEFEFE